MISQSPNNLVKIHLEDKSSRFISAIPQFLEGWIVSKNCDVKNLRVFETDREVALKLVERPDVQVNHPEWSVTGWELWFNPLASNEAYDARARKLTFSVDQNVLAALDLCIARNCMRTPVQHSPVFWLHIPKTAGTSFSHALSSLFSADKVLRVYPDVSGISLADTSILSASFKDHIEIVIGHYFYGLHKEYGITDPAYATVLRDPIDMMHSHLAYFRNLAEQEPVYDNLMTRLLSGGIDLGKGDVGKEHLEAAKENIKKNFVHVGYTFALQDSIDWICAQYRKAPIVAPFINTTHTSKVRKLPDYVDVSFDLDLYSWCRLTDPTHNRSLVERGAAKRSVI